MHNTLHYTIHNNEGTVQKYKYTHAHHKIATYTIGNTTFYLLLKTYSHGTN